SRPQRLIETARLMRPLFARALAEHEALLADAGAARFLRKQGWLKLYRGERAFDALKGELALAQEFGIPYRALDTDAARWLEPGPGLWLCRAVARCRQRDRPARRDQGLCGALCRARRRGGARECAFAPSRQRTLARRNRRRAARRRPGGGGARPFCPRGAFPA